MTPTAADLSSPYVQFLLAGMAELRMEIELKKQELNEFKRLLFGPRKERFIPVVANQLSLDLGEENNSHQLVNQTVHYQRMVKKVKQESDSRKPIRQPFPAHLPRVDVVIEPAEDITGMHKIGEEITEELDIKPALLFVRRYIRPRYVSREETFHIGALPVRVIDKGMPGSALLAQIMGDKFVLPRGVRICPSTGNASGTPS